MQDDTPPDMTRPLSAGGYFFGPLVLSSKGLFRQR